MKDHQMFFSFYSEDPESQPLNNFTCRTFFSLFSDAMEHILLV